MGCYEFNYTSNQAQPLPDVWVPCPSGDNCCIGLDTCMSNNICRDYGLVQARDNGAMLQPRSGSYSGYYNARCTDPTYTAPACDKICIDAPPDIVYNYTAQLWACCGQDQAGDVSCNAPKNEYYKAPAPGELSTLSAGAFFASTATLTPDSSNHPTTYSFVTASSVASSSSSMSSSTTSTSSVSSSLSSSTSTSASASSIPATSSDTATSSNSLSTGAKAGIGIGVTLGIILVLALIAFVLLRHRNRKASRLLDPSRQHMVEMASPPPLREAQGMYRKETPPLPPVELLVDHETDFRPMEASNAFSFQPSVR